MKGLIWGRSSDLQVGVGRPASKRGRTLVERARPCQPRAGAAIVITGCIYGDMTQEHNYKLSSCQDTGYG